MRIRSAALATLAISMFWTGGPAFATDTSPADDNIAPEPDRHTGAPSEAELGASKEDLQLVARIHRSLAQHRRLSKEARNIDVLVQNGAVTLRGSVKSEAEKATIERCAEKAAGPENVKSELAVQP